MGVVRFRSDLIHAASQQRDTITVRYTNRDDFAGIDYSAEPIFTIRLPIKFFKERGPETNESEDMSDGEVVKLSSSVKFQKLLEVDAVPYYLHNKIKLILQHNTVAIDGNLWLKEESYEYSNIGGDNSPEYPFKLGKCWLTSMSSYLTNIYGSLTNVPDIHRIFGEEFAEEFE